MLRVLGIDHVIGVLVFDGILDGDDVFGMVAAGPVDEGGEGGGFAGAGGAGDEAETGAFEDAVAEGFGGIGVDAEGFEFGDEIVEDAASDAEPGRAEMGLDAEAARAFALLAHRNAVAGEIRHPPFGEIVDGKADFLIDSQLDGLVLSETMATAFAVGDEFLEDPVHVGWGEDPEVIEFFHALVGVDIHRAGGPHLDIRNLDLPANAEDDAQQIPAGHARRKSCRSCRRGAAWERRRFEDCGGNGHVGRKLEI